MSQDKKNPKKAFAKPEIKKIPLAVEEAVLASCKGNGTGSGPGSTMGGCATKVMGVTTPCSTYGS